VKLPVPLIVPPITLACGAFSTGIHRIVGGDGTHRCHP